MVNRVDKPSVKDWLILGGLLGSIAIVALDIIAVRGRNKTLRVELEKSAVSAQVQVKQAEEKAAEEISRIEQKIKSFEKKAIEANKKTAEVEVECREKMDSLRIAHQNKLKEQKEDYEQRIAKMQEDFNKRLNDIKVSAAPQTTNVRAVNNPEKKVRCNRCQGHGIIKVQERCKTCNGRGRIEKETGREWVDERRLGGAYKTKLRIKKAVVDCPDCLPGAFKGGGSKGYTIESKQCPKCNGVGSVSAK